MIFTSLKFSSVVLGAVLAVSASFAVTDRGIPGLPLPLFPPGNVAVAGGIPGLPLPPFPPVNMALSA
jgi:hypothetical protein